MTPERWQQIKEVLRERPQSWIVRNAPRTWLRRVRAILLFVLRSSRCWTRSSVREPTCSTQRTRPMAQFPGSRSTRGSATASVPTKLSSLSAKAGWALCTEQVRIDDQYQKQVAVKLVHAGHDSAFIVSRFSRMNARYWPTFDHSQHRAPARRRHYPGRKLLTS